MKKQDKQSFYAGLDVGHCYARLFFADFRKDFHLVDHNIIISELN